MAKKTEIPKFKVGTRDFKLVGRAKVQDYTFGIDIPSQNNENYIYNKINLAIDCGADGNIYADLMGGFDQVKPYAINVHGKKDNGEGKMIDDFEARFSIEWEDRLDEEVLESVGDNCFLIVGLEVENDKINYKKFLSGYDMIAYLKENLTDGTVVTVKGQLKWQQYNGNVNYKKEIQSIILSKATEDKFGTVFHQTVLTNKDSIGQLDKDTRSIPLDVKIIDYAKTWNDISLEHKEGNKTVKGMNIPLNKTISLQLDINDSSETAVKKLKPFKAGNSKKLTEIVVEGRFTKAALNTTKVTLDDVSDDVRELIEMGYMDEEEILNQIALNNGGGKPEIMVITKPHIKFNEIDKPDGTKMRMPSLARIADKYTIEEVDMKNILDSLNISVDEEVDEDDLLADIEDDEDLAGMLSGL